MKRELSPIYLALMLVLGCVGFRVLKGLCPDFVPNISPLMAIAFVGAMYLPARWGWLVGPGALALTELAFLQVNYQTDGSGSMFSGWTLLCACIYALAGGLGILIARQKSLPRIVCGSLACSLSFYLAANTFSWWHDVAVGMNPGYAPTLAGWWQANTVGLPGYVPTWLFLRNGMAGDLFFVLLLLLVLDREVVWARSSVKAAARIASVW